MLTRRSALFGLLAAPAIIRTPGLLMPIKPVFEPFVITVHGPDLGKPMLEASVEMVTFVDEVSKHIASITGIPRDYLLGTVPPWQSGIPYKRWEILSRCVNDATLPCLVAQMVSTGSAHTP